jgi:hypothetical protein
MSQSRPKVSRIRLVAPLILIAFAVFWYEFSIVYIPRADNQLVAQDNLAVYVTIQQVTAYLQALRLTTYATVAVGALAFSYYLVKLLRFRAADARVSGQTEPSRQEASSRQAQP